MEKQIMVMAKLTILHHNSQNKLISGLGNILSLVLRHLSVGKRHIHHEFLLPCNLLPKLVHSLLSYCFAYQNVIILPIFAIF